MVALVVALLISLQAPPNYPDRTVFLHALVALPHGASKEEVIQALGKPDRVIPKGEAGETWYYGTDGPNGAATLAQFEMYNGELGYHPVATEPPPLEVISEAELRKGMHIVLDQMPEYNTDKQMICVWLTKTVNALLPFGDAKCKAIIGECGRVIQSYSFLDPCPFFLTYALFDPPSRPGFFDGEGLVWQADIPKNRLEHPRWPLEIIHNAPVIRGEPLGGMGRMGSKLC